MDGKDLTFQKRRIKMKDPRKNVVVTGGAGFFGSNFGQEIKIFGYNVFIIDTFAGGKKEYVPKGAKLIEADICDQKEINKVFKRIGKIYCVFHLAALPRVQYSIEEPMRSSEVNILGTVNLLKAATLAKARRFVYSASSSAYGDQEIMPLHENMPVNPKSPYGLQKYVGELFMKLWSEVYGLPTVSLRYFNVYGPNFDPEGPYALVVGKFLIQRKSGQPLTITGDGKQTRDFTHIKDVVKANILAMESSKVGKGESINIGAGRNITINRLAALVGGPIKYISPRLEPHDTKASNKLAKKLLGWEPSVSIEEGIKELKKSFGIK